MFFYSAMGREMFLFSLFFRGEGNGGERGEIE